MSTKIKTTKTAEQRKAEAEALQQSIAGQVEELRNSETWLAMLDFARQFHSYSLNNLILIFSQMSTASQVAGYRKWQSLDRQVRKGERGIRIFGTSEKKITEEDDNGEEVVKRRRIFFPVSVFDISQTELMDGAEPAPEVTVPLAGEDPLGIVATVADWLTSQGWTLERSAIPGAANGYAATDTRTVVVDEDLSPAQAAKTALHEAAHVILHSELSTAEYVNHRGVAETEAESVAYVVGGLLGLDTSDYTIGYIAGWSQGDAELIKNTAANVLKASHTLADALTDTEVHAVTT